jgi:hypothetical protein
MAVIPALGRQRQEDCEFENSLVYNTKTKKSWSWSSVVELA